MRKQTSKRLRKIYAKFSDSEKPAHKAYIESIRALVNLTEARDPYTKQHSAKVASLAASLAKHLELPKSYIEAIKIAAILHDIGKVGISSKVLLKKSFLIGEEYEKIKKHPQISVEIIKPLKFFDDLIPMIKHHHESFDGTGYPDGLKGENIPFGARLLAIADVYDALISKRAYRKAYSPRMALNIMKKESGKKFDSVLLMGFMDCLSSKAKRSRGAE